MVDLVTAGMSSDSFFSCLRDAVGSLSDDLATLVYYPISIPTGTALGTLNINFNLLDYTLGQTAPDLNALAEQAGFRCVAPWRKPAHREAQLDAWTEMVLARPQSRPSASTPRCWVWHSVVRFAVQPLG